MAFIKKKEKEKNRKKGKKRTSVSKDTEKLEPLCTVGGNIKWQALKKVWWFSKKLNTMFIAALFIIAKKWKQPKSPSMDEWMNLIYIQW